MRQLNDDPAPAPPRLTRESSAHQTPIPQAQRSTEAPGQAGTQAKGCPKKVSAPASRYDTHHDGPRGPPPDPLLYWWVAAWGVGYVTGCQGGAFLDCIKLIMGCLGKIPEVGKGMDLNYLGRNNCGKREVWGDKQRWLRVNSGLSSHAPTGAVGSHGWWCQCGVSAGQDASSWLDRGPGEDSSE